VCTAALRYTFDVASWGHSAVIQTPVRVISAVFVSLFLGTVLSAKPNFTGEWKMNASKSDFGTLPAPEKLVRTIEHKDPDITVKTVQVGHQGEVKTEFHYMTDGKEFTAKSTFGEIKGTAKWAGDTLVVETKRSVQGAEITQVDRWTLGEDGKSLSVHSVIQTPNGAFKMALSFEKQ
jgi:hypothetical protein